MYVGVCVCVYCVFINVLCLEVLHLSPGLAGMVWLALDLYGLVVKEIPIFYENSSCVYISGFILVYDCTFEKIVKLNKCCCLAAEKMQRKILYFSNELIFCTCKQSQNVQLFIHATLTN